MEIGNVKAIHQVTDKELTAPAEAATVAEVKAEETLVAG